jgi:hypothetical protein
MVGCYYATFWGQAFGWTQIFPSLVTLFFTFMRSVTHEIIFLFFGLYLWAAQFVIWVFQNYFESVRPNPVCQLYHSYAFPSVEAYYAAALAAFIVTYAYLWDRYLDWMAWSFIYVLFAFPAIMVYFGYNLWWEVLFSMAIGAGVTVVFTTVFRFYICPIMPFIVNEFPATWLGLQDTYLMTENERECESVINAVHSSARVGSH